MSDRELIEFLFKLLWGDLTDGDTPSDKELETLRIELWKRHILPDDGEFPC
jgi:hypothetical protein